MKTIYTKTLVLFCFLAMSQVSFGQDETLFGHGKVHFTGLWGGTYNAYTTFDDDFKYNGGGFFAFELNHNFLLGWTGYRTNLTLPDGRLSSLGGSDFMLGYTTNAHQVIHPVFYLQAGGGDLKINGEVDDKVFILQPNVGLEMNVFQWFRIGLEAGYRFVNNVDVADLEQDELSSPVIGLRLKFGFSSY